MDPRIIEDLGQIRRGDDVVLAAMRLTVEVLDEPLAEAKDDRRLIAAAVRDLVGVGADIDPHDREGTRDQPRCILRLQGIEREHPPPVRPGSLRSVRDAISSEDKSDARQTVLVGQRREPAAHLKAEAALAMLLVFRELALEEHIGLVEDQ